MVDVKVGGAKVALGPGCRRRRETLWAVLSIVMLVLTAVLRESQTRPRLLRAERRRSTKKYMMQFRVEP